MRELSKNVTYNAVNLLEVSLVQKTEMVSLHGKLRWGGKKKKKKRLCALPNQLNEWTFLCVPLPEPVCVSYKIMSISNIENPVCWKGHQGSCGPTSCLVQIPLEHGAASSVVSSISKDGNTELFLGNLAQSLAVLVALFSLCLITTSCNVTCIHCHLSFLGEPLWGSFFHLPHSLSLSSCRQI